MEFNRTNLNTKTSPIYLVLTVIFLILSVAGILLLFQINKTTKEVLTETVQTEDSAPIDTPTPVNTTPPATFIKPSPTIVSVASSSANFSIVVLPDSQNYATSFPDTYNSQTKFIVDNQKALNIVFATSVGDLVNTSSSSTEYKNADAAFDILDAGNIPYSVSPGNHDMDGSTLWSTYFGTSRFSKKTWYGGSLDNYNSYSLFSYQNMNFIIINLQRGPEKTQLDWADGLLKSNPNRYGIIVQHDILNVDNSWVNEDSFTALKDNPNLFLMLCGHMHTAADGAAYRAEAADDGHIVSIMQSDYQEYPEGGSGYLRILEFQSSTNKIQVKTFSPVTKKYLSDNQNQFTVNYKTIASAKTPTAATSNLTTKNYQSPSDGFSVDYSSLRKVVQDTEATGNRYTFSSTSGNFAVHVAAGDKWAWNNPSRSFSQNYLVAGQPTFKYDVTTQTIVDFQRNNKNYTVQCIHNGKTDLKTECDNFLKSIKLTSN